MKEKPTIYAERFTKLSPTDRAKLRAFIESPLYLQMLRIAAVFKPSANCTGTGSGKRDEFSDARANARLGEIRGWEMYEAAIFLALNEPAELKQAVQESFPDEGRVDAEWGKVPAARRKSVKS